MSLPLLKLIIQELEFLKIAYKISLSQTHMTIRVMGPSEYFLEYFKLERIPAIFKQLQNFIVQKECLNKITFQRKRTSQQTDFIALQKSLIQFFSSFRVCVMQTSPLKKNQVETLTKTLTQISNDLKIKLSDKKNETKAQQFIIYFKNDLKERIESTLNNFQGFQKQSVIFSLNFFIHSEIKQHLKLFFLDELLKKYAKQIKEIPEKNKNILSDVQILSVVPIKIDPYYRSKDWSKQEYQGIYGLQLIVQGEDYKIIKLYTCLQKFFKKINYCVSKREDNCSEIQMKAKLNHNKMIVLLFLRNEQIIVIGPPEEFEKSKSELLKSLHSIDRHLYPYYDFSIIKERANAFRRFLKDRLIDFQDLMISEQKFTFYSDKINSEKIKYHTKEFLRKYLLSDYDLDFIQTETDLRIFNKFVFSPLYIRFQDIELIWKDNSAFYRCPTTIGPNSFIQIKDLYEDHLKKLESITNLKKIEDPLIKRQTIDNFKPDKYFRWYFTAKEIQFAIQIKQLNSLEKENYSILMVGEYQKCPELLYLLDHSRVQQLKEKKIKFTQFILETNQMNIKSLKYWKVNYDKRHLYEERRDILFNDLMSLVKDQKQISLIITTEFLSPYFSNHLQCLLFKLIESELPICKKLTLLLSPRMSTSQKINFIIFVRHFLEVSLSEKMQVKSKIFFQSLNQIISLKFFELKWTYNSSDYKQGQFEASSLNSFIFYFQKVNTKLQGKKFGIFLPKNHLVEILVHLSSQKSYIVRNHLLVKVIDNSLIQRINKIVQILKSYFPFQSYIVLYSNQQKSNLITSIYVYQKESPQKLQKYVINTEQRKIMQAQTSPIAYKLTQLANIKRYRYQTHPQYQEEMKKLLFK